MSTDIHSDSPDVDNTVYQKTANDEFAKVLAKTLDESLDNIDEITLARLKKSRTQVLSHSLSASKKWIFLSVAASVAIVVALPVLWNNSNIENAAMTDVDLISQEVPPSEQELDDIDMLMAMDDSDV